MRRCTAWCVRAGRITPGPTPGEPGDQVRPISPVVPVLGPRWWCGSAGN